MSIAFQSIARVIQMWFVFTISSLFPFPSSYFFPVIEDVDYRAITGINIGEVIELFHSNHTDTRECETRQEQVMEIGLDSSKQHTHVSKYVSFSNENRWSKNSHKGRPWL